jgi:hypothetical protein
MSTTNDYPEKNIINAVSLADAYVKVRNALNYQGPLDFERFPNNKGITLVKFYPKNDKTKIVYVKF